MSTELAQIAASIEIEEGSAKSSDSEAADNQTSSPPVGIVVGL